ncbi:thioesterase family protein [Cellulomonas sp. Root137]|uniref:acyl-CoA thioesterase n=1 Tax=unclassified Cellulomonas TaxID=2620175 RepID=UPI0006FF640C|nr:thioesterase family protein [Cellulomonas sp. Root137]KQY44513.1 4-hydroxybenzoyl-CoA thioesterase [Cellulomonas sp. Root137]KRD41520.1 4-hydroxybenzoyl-CoA thioesterase [Cellulomonas sp. Root930]
MTRLEVPVQLRWSDMDAYQHVNNVEMLRLLEEARIEAFWSHPVAPDGSRVESAWPTAVLDAGPGAELSTLVARQEIEYLKPLGYRRTPVIVEMWLGHLGGASLDVCYEVRDAGDVGPERVTYARAVTTLVLVDAATGAPRRIGPEQRAAWSAYVEEPVTIRRRR